MQDSMSGLGESPRVMLQFPPPSLAPLLPWAAFSLVCAVPGLERTLFFFLSSKEAILNLLPP